MEIIQVAEIDCRDEETQKTITSILSNVYDVQRKFKDSLMIIVFERK